MRRGVAVPFTTPLLGGARARPDEAHSVELVIPSPSGSQGVYVMRWASIPALCRPTLHDRELSRRIMNEESVSPSSIRRAAREVAAAGLAGEDAREAAVAAEQSEGREQVLANYRLLMTLISQVRVAVPADSAGNPAARAQLTVDHVSRQLGQTTAWTALALERLAASMSAIGAGGDDMGRITRLLALLTEVRSDLLAWSHGQDAECQSQAALVGSFAELTLSTATAMVAEARARTSDVVKALRMWADEPAELSRCFARPEWMLDGWEQICLIWKHADDQSSRRAALAEIAGMIPVLPKEASDWCRDVDKHNDMLRHRKFIRLHEDWLTGVFDMERVGRNEHLRAVSCRMQATGAAHGSNDGWALPSFVRKANR